MICVQVEAPTRAEAAYSVTTIFKSGRNPGEFTRLVSTIYFDERRRRAADIAPSAREEVHTSRGVRSPEQLEPGLDTAFSSLHDLQSGLNF